MYFLEIKKIRDCWTWGTLKMICPEASNMISYDLHTTTCLLSGCRN